MKCLRLFAIFIFLMAVFPANGALAWDLRGLSIKFEVGGKKKEKAEPLDCASTLKKWCDKITSTAESSGDRCLKAAESGKTLNVFFNCGFITSIRLGFQRKKARSQCQRACNNECKGGLKKLCEVSNSAG